MDRLDSYNQSMTQIFLLLDVLDIATEEGLTKPKDKISYRDIRKNK